MDTLKWTSTSDSRHITVNSQGKETAIATFKLHNLTVTLTNSGQLQVTNEDRTYQLTTQAEKAARVALTKWNIAYGYAGGMQHAHPEPLDDNNARAFADAYATHTYLSHGCPTANIPDAYATWRETSQLDTIHHRYTRPFVYTLAEIRDIVGWSDDTRFIEIGPPPDTATT